MAAKVMLGLTLLSLSFVWVQGHDDGVADRQGRHYKASLTYSLQDILGSSIYSMLNRTYEGTERRFYSDLFSTETDSDLLWFFDVLYNGHIIPITLMGTLESSSNIARVLGYSVCGVLDADGNKIVKEIRSKELFNIANYFEGFINFHYATQNNLDPQHKIFCDIDVHLVYKPDAILDDVKLPNRSTNVIKRGRPYKATSFTCSLKELLGSKLESMLDRSYNGPEISFKSGLMSTEAHRDVQWYFRVNYDRAKGIFFYLFLSSLPSNVERVFTRAECGYIDPIGSEWPVAGMRRHQPLTVGAYLELSKTFPYEKVPSQADYDPQYRIYCELLLYSSFIIFKDNATEVVTTTKNEIVTLKTDDPTSTEDEMVIKLKDEVTKLKEEMTKMKDEMTKIRDDYPNTNESRSLHCRKELTMETLKALFNGTIKGDVELKSDYKTIKCNSGILSSRMTSFNLTGTVHDFSDELQPEQLEELVDFIYWGTMKNWKPSCRVLVEVALKYGFECLKMTCEDVLVNQMRDVSQDVKSQPYV